MFIRIVFLRKHPDKPNVWTKDNYTKRIEAEEYDVKIKDGMLFLETFVDQKRKGYYEFPKMNKSGRSVDVFIENNQGDSVDRH